MSGLQPSGDMHISGSSLQNVLQFTFWSFVNRSERTYKRKCPNGILGVKSTSTALFETRNALASICDECQSCCKLIYDFMSKQSVQLQTRSELLFVGQATTRHDRDEWQHGVGGRKVLRRPAVRACVRLGRADLLVHAEVQSLVVQPVHEGRYGLPYSAHAMG